MRCQTVTRLTPVPGLTPLKILLENFVGNGGKILVCIPCIEERNISADDLIEGAELCKAGMVVIEVTAAKSTVVY
jgi:predicted peroxiredoxin